MKFYEWHEVDGAVRGHPSLVECPLCGADAGERCASHKHGTFHKARVEAYFEERKARQRLLSFQQENAGSW